MNIFVLDLDPIEAAKMQCDKHVVKMVLESAQILSTVTEGPYKPTHVHHPCTKWVRLTSDNFNWMVLHSLALAEEYEFRYKKIHACKSVILQCRNGSSKIKNGGLTPFALAMPEEFKQADPVESYRAYYHSKLFAVWNRGREAPAWWDITLNQKFKEREI